MYEYPMICVREVIANALVHRDYQDGNRNSHFRIFSDRIEIVSPGEWVAKPLEPGVAYSLKQLQAESSKKNFTLAKVLSWIRLVEGEGSGIPAAVRNCQEIGAPIPKVIQQDGFVKVIIKPIPDWPPLASEFARLRETQEPFHCGIVGIDIEGYARPERTDPMRAEQRTRLYDLVGEALAQADIPLSSIMQTDSGDGFLLLVSPRVSTARLLHPFATGLAGRLADSNRDVSATEWLRLRIVVHAGTVLAGAHGFAGASIVHAARLLDARTTSALMAGNPAAAALVISDEVYQDVVRHAYPGIDPAGWQAMRVHVKETTTRAWIHLPGLTTQPSLPTVLAAPHAAPASVPIPHELPRPIADFTGREDELAALERWLNPDERSGGRSTQPVLISAIDGMGGVGKSALAIQVAYRLADAFPDGQLYVDLQGASPGVGPLAAHDALSRMLRSLGSDPADIPVGVEEAAARFRSLAAERRLLVLLDNAASPEQVRFLLPGSPMCGVLVTSRHVLATLEGTRAIHLDVFSGGQALELLGRLAGQQRIAAEQQAADEVVDWCGRLPLAIRIAGALLASRPGSLVQTLVERLTDARRRLETLQVGDLGLRASFDASLNALLESPDPRDRSAAAAFGVLSLPEGPDIGLTAAARLLDQPESITEELLERLVEAHLLESLRPRRYQFHSLVRLYAREFAVSQHDETDRLAMLTRMIGFYTATTWRTMALLRPGDQRETTGDPRWSNDGLQFADAPTALAWLEVEHVNLLSAINQTAMTMTADTSVLPARLAGQLARALFGFFEIRGYWQDGLQVNRTVLELARRARDRHAEAHANNDLGAFHQRLGQYQEAMSCLQQSLSLFRDLGDRQGQASSLNLLGLVHWRLGRSAEAISSQRESLSLYREASDHYGEARSLSNLGLVHSQANKHAEAVDFLQQSLSLFWELGDRQGQAISLNNLGNVYDRLGRPAEAVDFLQQSLSLFRELGDRHGQAEALRNLGRASDRLGRPAEAVACQQQSLSLFRELGDRRGQAEALRDLGDALRAVGRDDQARLAWQEALGICETLRIPETDDVRARLAAQPSEDTP
jgi:tetratricopeptide (TPR) repeat protein